MTSRLRLSIEFICLAALAASAQTAEEFFNDGARLYISNNIPAALQRVENGRKIYSDDEKLKKLEELLKQQQQQQQQNQQNPSSNGQQGQQQQNQKNSSGDHKNSQTKSPPADQKPSEPQKPAAASSASASPEPGKNDEKPPGERELSAEDARRLLDAQKGNEQVLQMRPSTPSKSPEKLIKDW